MIAKTPLISRLLIRLSAKRFSHKEKILLILLAAALMGVGHRGLIQWTRTVAQRQVVVQPLIPQDEPKTIFQASADQTLPAMTQGTEIDSPLLRDPFLSSRNPQRLVVPAPQRPTVSLIVNGILWDDTTPTAIINSRVVGIGDIIFGKAVVDIERDRVIVMEDGNIQVLYLNK